MKRTYQPSKIAARASTAFARAWRRVGGRKVLSARRAKGRARLAA